MLLERNGAIIPNVLIPTPAEVDAVSDAAASAQSSAELALATAADLATTVTNLDAGVSALSGTQIVYGSCVYFGSQGVEVNTNATAVILGMELASNTVSTTFVEIWVHYSDPMANTGIQTATTPNSSTWQQETILQSELTTYPVAGTPIDCYHMLFGMPAATNVSMIRANGELQEVVVGQVNVLDGLTINGIRGVTITNSIGIFNDGLLVEPIGGM